VPTSYRQNQGVFRVDEERPPSVLRRRGVNAFALFAGLAVAVMFHGLAAAILVFASTLGGGASAAAAAALEEAPEELPPEVQFVDARMLKLGSERDRRRLPTKLRQSATTGAPEPASTPTKNAERVRRDPEQQRAQNPTIEDIMARAGELSEQDRVREVEGDARGVEGGTDTEADDRQAYFGRLVAFFRRGFIVPPSIPDDQRRSLRSVVRVQISSGGIVESYQAGPSGNAEFDTGVRMRMDQAVGARVPEPPTPELRAEIFGSTVPFQMTPPR
jgi:hypothetical protein